MKNARNLMMIIGLAIAAAACESEGYAILESPDVAVDPGPEDVSVERDVIEAEAEPAPDAAEAAPEPSESESVDCVPIPCQELGCGLQEDGCGNTIDCGPCCGTTCVMILDDDLTSPSSGGIPMRLAQEGGEFIAGTGWQVKNTLDRIVYDLGRSIDCGYFEVTVANFDPPTQVRDGFGGQCPYHGCQGEGGAPPNQWCECDATPIGLFEGENGSMHTSAGFCQSWLHFRVYGYLPDVPDFFSTGTINNQAKVKYGAYGWAGGADIPSGPVFGWDPGATMVFRADWNLSGVSIKVYKSGTPMWEASGPLLWPGDAGFTPAPETCTGPRRGMRSRYLFIGIDHFVYPASPVGAIYQRVKAFDCGG